MYFLSFLFSCHVADTEKRSGAEVYQTFCIHCHQANGQGVPTRYPPLNGSQWLKGTIPIKIVLHGLKGPIEVNGETYNNVMAPWGNVLTDQEIANVIMYIRTSWNNSATYNKEPAITSDDVKNIREKFKGASNWTIEKAQSTQ
ncbi:MAG: cytochrome C [Deltaproteobacteria bacterium]|nr:cytochrome C [Deltaproteobacteria bacterium]